MSVCAECGRLMRPRNTTAAQYPGTVSYNGDRCGACSGREQRALHGPRVRPQTTVKCPRCGIERELSTTTATLCADCRSVLTPQERALWAA